MKITLQMLKKCAVLFASAFSVITVACASVKIETDENSKSKIIYSERMLKVKDFYGANFFIVESMNPKFSGFDTKIFTMMKKMISDGSAKAAIKENCAFIKKGEVIISAPVGEESWKGLFIMNVLYDKESNSYKEYNFGLDIYEDIYAQYVDFEASTYSYIDKCRQNIDACDENIKRCNEIISACSNPSIQKSRVISVPYTVTERYWVAGSIGRRTNSSFGSTEGTPGHYETRQYTAYRNETEYYTVPNPNYNPNAVAKAQSDISYWNKEKVKWNNEKDEAYEDLGNLPLPFTLKPWEPSGDSN